MRGQLARGAAWMVLFKWADRSLGLLSTLILARLLIPADFGVVAMAMSVIAVIELATAFSFDVALIQKQTLRRDHYDTAWTLNVLLAAGAAAATLMLAPLTAEFYSEPRLGAVMVALAMGWFIWGFESTGVVDFRRTLDFRREFRFLAVKRLVAFAITVAAAITFRSYWALVAGMVAGRTTGVVLSYAMHPYRPRFSVSSSRELLSFSGWMLATNALSATISRIPHFFIGRTQGAQALGAYTVGAEFAQLAHTELASPINRALFPGFARLLDQPEQLRRISADATAAMMLIVLPASIGVAAVAEPMVRVVLGEQWRAAVPVIQILAVSGAISAFVSNNMAIYMAIGKPGLVTFILLCRLVAMLPLLGLLGNRGLVGVALAELGSSLVCLAVSFPVLLSRVQLSGRAFVSALWRPLLASLLMGGVVFGAVRWLAGDQSLSTSIIQLGVGVPVGVAAYLILVYVFWLLSKRPESAEALLVLRLRDLIRARRNRGTPAESP